MRNLVPGRLLRQTQGRRDSRVRRATGGLREVMDASAPPAGLDSGAEGSEERANDELSARELWACVHDGNPG